jgi:hypothetical protein
VCKHFTDQLQRDRYPAINTLLAIGGMQQEIPRGGGVRTIALPM